MPYNRGTYLRNQKSMIEASRKYRQKLRHIVLYHYSLTSKITCACCGEDEYLFLCLDHKNNDGAQHRREVGSGARLYQWIIKNEFPEGFQVLCYNCNSVKGWYGYCKVHRDKEIDP